MLLIKPCYATTVMYVMSSVCHVVMLCSDVIHAGCYDMLCNNRHACYVVKHVMSSCYVVMSFVLAVMTCYVAIVMLCWLLGGDGMLCWL